MSSDSKVLLILFVGAFISLLNETLLNVALPSIMVDFGVDATQVQWVSTSYMLILGIVAPSSAYFMQRFSGWSICRVNLALFAFGMMISSLAVNFPMLIMGRIIQAMGAATMFPLLMFTLLMVVPVDRRGRAMGFVSTALSFAPAIGPSISGFILSVSSDWRMLFDLTIPIILFLLVATVWKMRSFVVPNRNMKLDISSLVLSTLSFGSLLYSLSQVSSLLSWYVFPFLPVGVISLFIFINRQLKLEHPLLEFRIFLYTNYSLAVFVLFCLASDLFSGSLLLLLYLDIRSFSPFDAGILMLPGGLLLAISSSFVGSIYDRYGPRYLLISGFSFLFVSNLLFSAIDDATSYPSLMTIYIVRAVGLALVITPLFTAASSSIPMKYSSHVTAMNSSVFPIFGSIGIAVMLSITASAVHGIKVSFLVSAMISAVAVFSVLFLKRPSIDPIDKLTKIT